MIKEKDLEKTSRFESIKNKLSAIGEAAINVAGFASLLAFVAMIDISVVEQSWKDEADYQATGGYDISGQPPTYTVTLRESAYYAPSKEGIWRQAFSKVQIESGCSLSSGTHIDEISKPYIFGLGKRIIQPEGYIVPVVCSTPES